MRSKSMPPRSDASTSSSGRPLTFEEEPADLEDSGPRRRDRWYTTGEMARLSNNTLRTVRFYEEAEILRPIGRTEGGHRLFGRSELDRLLFVSDLREAGMSLEEIRLLLDAEEQAGTRAPAARALATSLRTRLDNLNHKMEVLGRLREDLSKSIEAVTTVAACEGHKFAPESCATCAALESQKSLPRGFRVLLPVRSKEEPRVRETPMAQAANERRR